MSTSSILPQKTALDDVTQCPLCLYQLQSPHTLQQCLHSFCRACIDELPKDEKDGSLGWCCPVCKTFSDENSLKENNFLKELMSLDTLQLNTDRVLCKQCPDETEAKWQCIDCKIELCSRCQVSHLMIPILKGHKVTSLEDKKKPKEKIIDNLMFCSKHSDEPIKFNCKTCEVPICMKCKIKEHDMHQSEMVDEANERLMQAMNQYTKQIAENVGYTELKVKLVRQKIEETKNDYIASNKTVDQRVTDLITKLEDMRKKIKEDLQTSEKESIKSLETIKCDLENDINKHEHLLQLATVTSAKAQNMSLMTQLQGGLLGKLKDKYLLEPKPLSLKVTVQKLRLSLDLLNEDKTNKVLSGVLGQMFNDTRICELNSMGVQCEQKNTLPNTIPLQPQQSYGEQAHVMEEGRALVEAANQSQLQPKRDMIPTKSAALRSLRSERQVEAANQSQLQPKRDIIPTKSTALRSLRSARQSRDALHGNTTFTRDRAGVPPQVAPRSRQVASRTASHLRTDKMAASYQGQSVSPQHQLTGRKEYRSLVVEENKICPVCKMAFHQTTSEECFNTHVESHFT